MRPSENQHCEDPSGCAEKAYRWWGGRWLCATHARDAEAALMAQEAKVTTGFYVYKAKGGWVLADQDKRPIQMLGTSDSNEDGVAAAVRWWCEELDLPLTMPVVFDPNLGEGRSRKK